MPLHVHVVILFLLHTTFLLYSRKVRHSVGERLIHVLLQVYIETDHRALIKIKSAKGKGNKSKTCIDYSVINFIGSRSFPFIVDLMQMYGRRTRL